MKGEPAAEMPPAPWASTPMGRARSAAQISAGAVLVTTFAMLEDFMDALGFPPKDWVAGVEFRYGICFSTLLMAGSNSVRHAREWTRTWTASFVKALMHEAKEGEDPIALIAYDKRQSASIDPLADAVDGAIGPSGSISLVAYETLMTLSDGGSWPTFFRRLIWLARSVAGDNETLQAACARAVQIRSERSAGTA
jgi:hypothetical protein